MFNLFLFFIKYKIKYKKYEPNEKNIRLIYETNNK